MAVDAPPRRRRTAPPTPHASYDERVAAGRAARKQVPRTSLGAWSPDAARPDPVLVLMRQGESRLPELLPIRYGRMLASPFAFLRGSAAVMAGDLAHEPATGLLVQACGDAHLGNFGTYAGPDRRLVFDLNDFDETLRAPFEWDVKRLAASIEVLGRDRGLGADARRRAALAAGQAYREAMRKFASMRTLDIWYARIDVEEIRAVVEERGAPADELRRLDRHVSRAQGRDSLRALTKLTEVVDGSRRVRHDPPLLIPLARLVEPDEQARMLQLLRGYLRRYRTALPPAARTLLDRFQLVDIARKVVGVGSVGLRAWVVLLLGRDDGDPLVLQVKEAQPSVLEPHIAHPADKQHGRRIVEGQKLTQAASDALLGWISGVAPDGVQRDFYVRQLWDRKGSIDLDAMTSRRLRAYSALCGLALARAHARSGDAVAIAAYLGGGDSFERAMAAFAAAYADVTVADHGALARAAQQGIIDAEEER
jgi:uncharacterized protein (DUF2252 family)